MAYINRLGILGNLKKVIADLTDTGIKVNNNKVEADTTQALNEDIMCELDNVDRIAEIETALCELDERLGNING